MAVGLRVGVRIEATADRQFGTNSYLVEDEETKDAVIVDANLEPELMLDLVRRRGVNVRAILLTHTDVDHIGGLARLLSSFAVPVAVLSVVWSGQGPPLWVYSARFVAPPISPRLKPCAPNHPPITGPRSSNGPG